MNITIPKPVNEVLSLLYEKNYEGYLIGPTVRKMVMNEKIDKYIIGTNADVSKLQKILKDYKTRLVGENDQTLVVENNKFPMEISEYTSADNTLETYLREQDFTMNSMAYSDEDGLIDYGTGVIDIKNEVLKLNGSDDENLISDPLRILKAIRLSGEYKMRIDLQTVEYMFDNKELLKEVAPERIRDELIRILRVDKCAFYIKKYFDIFLVVIPELTLMERFLQNNPEHIYDVLEHTLVAMKNSDNDYLLRLAILLHDIGKPLCYVEDENGIGHFPNHCKKGADMAREILNRLKFNKRDIQVVTKIIEYHDLQIPEKENQLRQFIARFDEIELEMLFKLKKSNTLGKNPSCVNELKKLDRDYEKIQEILKRRTCIKKNELKIRGKDLLDLGVKQEELGRTLDTLYSEVLENNLKNHKDQLVSYVIKNILPASYED